MRPVSPRFLAALRGAHVVGARCDLWFPGETVAVQVPIEAGEVTTDRLADVRRTGQVEIPWSLEAGADLGLDLRTLAYGGYVTLHRGLRFADGTRELVPVGHLRVESVTWDTNADAASLELADRMAQVRDEPFLAPYVPLGGAGVTRSGTLTNGSAVVTGLSTTSDLLVGMSVTGVGVPPGTTIASIDSGTQVTLSHTVALAAVKDVQGLANSKVLYGMSDTSNLSPGMDIVIGFNTNGDRIEKPGTKIASVDSSSQITMTLPTNNVTFWEPGSAPGWARVDFSGAGTQSLFFSGGVRIADAAVEIVHQVFGSTILYRKLSDPNVITSDAYFSESRSETVMELARAGASEAYFDADGNFVYDLVPGTADPVWDVDAGETGVLVAAAEALARTGVYNGVLVEGQATADAPPVTALVTDDDPVSPTRWGGPFGKVARIDTSTAVQTTGQAQTVAQAILDSQLGLARSLTLTEAPHPGLEAGDVIRVTFPDGRVELHVVDTVRLDLGTGPQELSTRSIYTGGALEMAVPIVSGRHGVFHDAAAWREAAQARVSA
jgi:Domain of unknown function (DUF5047)